MLTKSIVMPGTKSSGRPGGNPELKKYSFTTDREEPLREKIQFRAPLSLKEKLYAKENWQEFVRQTLLEKLEAESA